MNSTRRARAVGTLLFVAALVMLGYRGIPSTGFASEDFLILGYLHRRPLAEVFLDQLVSPWLDLEFVGFYRPVSTLLLGLGIKAWGLEPRAFHFTLLAVHALNAWLIWAIARALAAGPGLALAAAALFALSPLHASAVAFIGGYATVLGSGFGLLAWWSFLRFRDGGRRRHLLLALCGFALALGSYEGAVVLPPVLAAAALLSGRTTADAAGNDWRCRWRDLQPALPFFLLLGAYFLVRRAVLGVFVGGYGVLRERWLGRAGDLFVDFLASLPLLLAADLHRPWPRGLLAGLGGVVVAAAVAVRLARRRRALAPLALAALVWAALFQLPFSFVRAIPATGRFWYLAAFAGTLAPLAAAWAWMPGRDRRPRAHRVLRALAVAAVVLLAGHHLRLLRADLGRYQEADLEVRQLRLAVASQPALGASVPLLIAGVPDFARSPDGLPVAKVFQYGLHEATTPPFAKAGTFVYPLPTDAPARLLPALARAAGGRVLAWDSDRRLLVPLAQAGPLPDGVRRIELTGPPPGAPSAASAGGIGFLCAGCSRVRLFVVTPGPPYRGDWVDVEENRGAVPVPGGFLRGMAGLYRGEALAWLEERDSHGRLAAASEVFQLPLSSFLETRPEG